MTAPAAQAYGYAHRGSVVGPSELDGYWMVRCSAINPARPIGPYASTVPDLAIDDRVLLTQIGTSRDDLVITGKLPAVPWDANLPIDIADVTGLQVALDARATDAELAALAGTVSTQGGLITGVQGVNTTQNGRLTALEAADITLAAADSALAAADAALDGRLDIVEPLVTANGVAITALQAADTAFATYSVMNDQRETDMFADVVSSFPRHFIANTRLLANTGGYFVRTRIRKAQSVAFMRVFVTVAGTGAGTTTAILYRSTTPTGTYTQIASGTNALATTGEAAFTIGSVALAAGDYLVMHIRPLGYTAAPSIGMLQNNVRIDATKNAMNPGVGRYAWVTKSIAGTPPTTIDIQDGTYTLDISPWWVALA